MSSKYVFNKHIAPITCNGRDKNGKVILTKKFLPETTNGTTGRIVSTGFTELTEAEYDSLMATSKTFKKYSQELKLLSVQDDIPPSAKTPHEALVSERKKTRDLEVELAKAAKTNTELEAKIAELETKYGQLVTASGGKVKGKGEGKDIDPSGGDDQ